MNLLQELKLHGAISRDDEEMMRYGGVDLFDTAPIYVRFDRIISLTVITRTFNTPKQLRKQIASLAVGQIHVAYNALNMTFLDLTVPRCRRLVLYTICRELRRKLVNAGL